MNKKKGYAIPKITVKEIKVQLLAYSDETTGEVTDPTYDCGCSCADCAAGNHDGCTTGKCGFQDAKKALFFDFDY